MADNTLLKAAQALDAAMDDQDFVATDWPVSLRFRKAVKSATAEAEDAEEAEATAPAAIDAPEPVNGALSAESPPQ